MADAPEEVMIDEGSPVQSEPDDRGREFSPAEEKARVSGWVPEDEWEGDPADWVDAHHFNIRGELMSRIQSQTRQLSTREKEIKELKEAMHVLGEHNRKIAEVQYAKAMKDLRSQRQEAYSSGDHELADEIEEQLDDLKTAKKQLDSESKEEQEQPQPGQAPKADPVLVEAFQEFLTDSANNWYKTDPVLRGAANAIGDQLILEGVEPHEAFKKLVVQIKKEFPHKFGGANKNVSAVDEPSSVRRTGTPKGKKQKYSARDLTPDEYRVAKTFVEAGAFKNIDEYLEQYAEIGGFQGDRL